MKYKCDRDPEPYAFRTDPKSEGAAAFHANPTQLLQHTIDSMRYDHHNHGKNIQQEP